MPEPRRRILALANQKGGVGKTTTAINLATAMAAVGETVLLVDLDPQGNASTGLGIDRDRRGTGTYAMLTGRASVAEAALPTMIPGLSIVPADPDLAGAEIELAGEARREFHLKQALADAPGGATVLIDCPPSLGLLTVNGLVAAGRGAGSLAMRVLRPGRDQPTGEDD